MFPPSWISLLPSALSPTWVIIEPGFEFPESYSKFPLALYLHMLVYMSPCCSLHLSHPLLLPHPYPSVHCSKTWKQPRCPSTDEWIKKLWYVYAMEYCSAIKRNDAHELVLMRWMNLEPIIQSEVSQKRNINIIYWHTHIYMDSKRWYRWIYFQGISGETDIESRAMDKGRGEEGEDEMYAESNMETYNTICKIDSQ